MKLFESKYIHTIKLLKRHSKVDDFRGFLKLIISIRQHGKKYQGNDKKTIHLSNKETMIKAQCVKQRDLYRFALYLMTLIFILRHPPLTSTKTVKSGFAGTGGLDRETFSRRGDFCVTVQFLHTLEETDVSETLSKGKVFMLRD